MSRVARSHRWLPAGAAAAVVLAGPLVPAAAATSASDTTVTIDISQTGKTPTRAGAGFLYGLSQDGSGPADSLLAPLAPTLFRGGGARIDGGGWIGDGYTAGPGYRARITSALDQARRVTAAPYHATYHLLVSDLYGTDTTQPADTAYPCDNGDCTNWTRFLDQVVTDVQSSGLTVAYDIWNEPDGTGFWQRGVNSAQYFQMWNSAVREIRRLDPHAVVVGPSYSGYNHGWLDQFLGQTSHDSTLPDVLNWHFGADPATDSADAAQLVAAHGLPPMPQTINEYLFSHEQTAGRTAWFLNRLAVSDVGAAAHAIWSDCCTAGTLDSVLAGAGDNAAPTGQWWVYRAYASLTGNLVAATSSDPGIAAAAAADRTSGQANILLGNNSGQAGTTTVTIGGLSTVPWLTSGGTVHVAAYRIPDQSPLWAPVTAFDAPVAIHDGAVSLALTFASGTDAYWLVLSPGGAGPACLTGTRSGPLAVARGQAICVTGGRVAGPVTVADGGALWISQGSVTGPVTVAAGGQLRAEGATLQGPISASGKLTLCGNTISGPITVTGASAPVTIGGTGCGGNTITGPVRITGASGAVDFCGNHVVGPVTIQGNTGSLRYVGNTVTGPTDIQPIHTIVDGTVTGTGPDEFEYGANWGVTTGVGDMYDQTANWTYTAGATAMFRFVGTQVALHAVRDVDQGIMSIALDGGSAQDVDNYAPVRDASGVVWTSPVLPAGNHTLTITNTGRRNAASSGNNIAIDRADVTS